jgi:hypothetical protein
MVSYDIFSEKAPGANPPCLKTTAAKYIWQHTKTRQRHQDAIRRLDLDDFVSFGGKVWPH